MCCVQIHFGDFVFLSDFSVHHRRPSAQQDASGLFLFVSICFLFFPEALSDFPFVR
jgi:hypothetical protein